MNVSVMAVPANILPGALDGAAAIVIDALRMTSVAVTALHNGCAGVLACPGVEEAKAAAVRSEALLGGERNALLIPGFDFSNSPLEYTAEKVAGRNLVMSTSNGTKAIAAASSAKRVLLAAFVNAKAAAEAGQWETNLVRDSEQEDLKKLAELGMTVTEVDKSLWIEAAQPVYEKFASSYDQNLIALINALK